MIAALLPLALAADGEGGGASAGATEPATAAAPPPATSAAPPPATSAAPPFAARRWELAVGPWVGQHAPQDAASTKTGLAWGGRARARWTEAWGVELTLGTQPEGPAGNLALVRFLGNPSADLVGHVAAGVGVQADRSALVSVGGGFDVVLAPFLDLRADGRLEIDDRGTSALLFAISPMVHTRRVYDGDADGVPDRADRCPRDVEDRDGHDDADGCPDPDNDADGVIDLADACADVAEDRDGVLDKDGCPDMDDDDDGVFDALDACRHAREDHDGFEDHDGCPDPDNDRDLVRDELDRCADVREDVDGFQDDDGCPEPDNDGDGVADRWDGAPGAAETYNGWEDEDGVPDAVPPVLARLLGPLDVRFWSDGAAVRAEGDRIALLAAVLASFPTARVELRVAAPHAAEARAAALLAALVAAGAPEEQVVLRPEAGPERVTLGLVRP